MRRSITYYLDGRLFEWVLSVSTVVSSVLVFVWPRSVQTGAFQSLSKIMSPTNTGVYLLVVGVFGTCALAMNGSSLVIGPFIRSVCAVLRALMWTQFMYSLFILGMSRDAPSLITPFWFFAACGELYVAYRAMIDVRVRRGS